jgi:pyroglutamyl-peptidase
MTVAILTGFEPFGPYKFNPTQDIAKEFDGQSIGEVKVRGIVLPASYTRAYDILLDAIKQEKANIVLSSGLASTVRGIRLEAVGRNNMQSKYPDCDGRMPQNEKISITGALEYYTNTSTINLATCLQEAGIDSETSSNADTYICNSLLYQVSQAIREESLPVKFAFFHTPWTRDYLDRINLEPGKKTISKASLKKTVEILITELNKAKMFPIR